MLRDYIEAFLRLFQGLEDRHAIQLDNGEYRPRLFGLRDIDVEEHLFRTSTTLGIYLLRYDDTVCLACIDIDIDTPKLVAVESKEGMAGRRRLFEIAKQEAQKQSEKLTALGLPHAIEFSGKRGYHLWIFFKDPIPAYYVFRLREMLVIDRSPDLTADWKFGDKYEFFPKQAYTSGKGYGNLIKLPMGKHRVSKQFSYFLDPHTMERREHQLEFLIELDKNYRIKKDMIEALLKETIVYPDVVDVVGDKKRKTASHLRSRFTVTIPDKESFESILAEMLSCITPYNPINNNGSVNSDHIDQCPPCIYNAYICSKTLPSQFESRTILVRYLANLKRKNGRIGFSPNDIAGFMQWEINRDEDRLHPERMQYYIAYYYGEIGNPSHMDSCQKLQEKGFCINFDYKPVEIKKLDIILKAKELWRMEEKTDEMLNIKKMNEIRSAKNKWDLLEEKEKEKTAWIKTSETYPDDYSKILADLDEEIALLRTHIKDEFDLIKETYKIKCERIWSPFSQNNEYNKIAKGTSASIEDVDGFNKKGTARHDKEDITRHDHDKEDTTEPEEPLPTSGDTDEEILDSLEPSKERSSQSSSSDEFAEINRLSFNALASMTKESTPLINEVQKSTRVGVTTSFILSAKLQNLRILLLEPTNMIGLDTFSQTVKISEDEFHKSKGTTFREPIYGGVFGSNLTMCLKWYEKVQKELLDEFDVSSIRELAVSDLPFVFKSACVTHKESGEDEYCPYFCCIHIGYPTSGGNVTPIITSQLIKKQEGSWCTRYHHLVNATDKCYHASDLEYDDTIICTTCPNKYFKEKYQYIDADSIPICGYASVFRHLIEDTVNIRVYRLPFTDEEIFKRNKTGKIVILPENKVMELIENGFISKDVSFLSQTETEPQQGLLNEEGKLKDEINIILNVKLKPFDSLVMTYSKVISLYESVENLRRVGLSGLSEEIVNVIKYSAFDGILCDEVSHLVAQSPLTFSLFSIGRQLDEFGNMLNDTEAVPENCFDKIEKELDTLKLTMTKKRKRDERSEDKSIYFIILRDYFAGLFANVKHWVLNINDITDMFAREDLSEYNHMAREVNKNVVDMVMDDIVNMRDSVAYQKITEKIRLLQDQGYLEGKVEIPYEKRIDYKRFKVRFIDVYSKRIEMRRIAIRLRDYYKRTHTDEENEADEDQEASFNWREELRKSKQQQIDDEGEYHLLLEQYKQLKAFITIQEEEIGIINELLRRFDDNVYDTDGTPIGKFDGYRLKTFVVIGYAWVNIKLLDEIIDAEDIRDHKGNKRSADELFLDMYSMLVKLAVSQNVSFPYLTNMLLIANAPSFFITATTTNEYKTKIILQSIPSFDNIIDLVSGVVKSQNKTPDRHNFAITTDATMPLIEMSSVFGIPTKIWKFGDPKETCKKQLIIGDSKNINTGDLFSKRIITKSIHDTQEFIGDDPELELLYEAQHKEEIDEKELKKLTNVNRFYVIKTADGKVEYVDVSKYLVRFRLFVFINTLAEKYSASNIFIISPNKTFDYFLSKGMREGNTGIPLDDLFIGWLQTNYPMDFAEYCTKGWIQEDSVRNLVSEEKHYAFHLTDQSEFGDKQYYRGNRTIGTSSTCRIMLVITSPSSPLNSYEWLAHFYYDKNFMHDKQSRIGGLSIPELSKALRRVELQSSAFQTFSRVKDPKAQHQSVVFAWGIGNTPFVWAKCQYCGRNEVQIYMAKPHSMFDTELKIQDDDIYMTDRKDAKGNNMDLCYDCIRQLKATVLGVAERRKNNYCTDPKGIQDYLAFKIPTPSVISMTTTDISNQHFFESERRMMEVADIFLNHTPIPSPDILRFRNILVNRTVEAIISNGMNIDLVSEGEIEEFLQFPTVDLAFWSYERVGEKTVKKRIYWRYLEEVLEKYGLDNLKEVNIGYTKTKKTYCFYLRNLSPIKEYVEIANRKKGITKLLQPSSV